MQINGVFKYANALFVNLSIHNQLTGRPPKRLFDSHQLEWEKEKQHCCLQCPVRSILVFVSLCYFNYFLNLFYTIEGVPGCLMPKKKEKI